MFKRAIPSCGDDGYSFCFGKKRQKSIISVTILRISIHNLYFRRTFLHMFFYVPLENYA